MTRRVFVSHGWNDRWIARQFAYCITNQAKAEAFIDIFDIKKATALKGEFARNYPNATNSLRC